MKLGALITVKLVTLVVGVLIGVAATVAYAMANDRDIRELFAKGQKNIDESDLDQVHGQVRQEITNARAKVEEALGQAKAVAADASANEVDDTESASDTVAIATA
jgi:hypothetical protein